MAVLTNLELFTGTINIDWSTRGVEAELQEYCELIEGEAIKALLGRSLYTEYEEDSTVTKFDELINGIDGTFTYGSETRNFKGLKNKFCYLIYYRYLMDQYASNTAFGDVKPNSTGGTYQANVPRLVRAYNKWVDAFNDTIDFINYKNSLVLNAYTPFNTSKLEYINSFGI